MELVLRTHAQLQRIDERDKVLSSNIVLECGDRNGARIDGPELFPRPTSQSPARLRSNARLSLVPQLVFGGVQQDGPSWPGPDYEASAQDERWTHSVPGHELFN